MNDEMEQLRQFALAWVCPGCCGLTAEDAPCDDKVCNDARRALNEGETRTTKSAAELLEEADLRCCYDLDEGHAPGRYTLPRRSHVARD